MKIVDKRGKLFGVINIFDLFVLVMLTMSVILSYKWSRMADDPSWVNVRVYHVRCVAESAFAPYIIDLVKAGDEMINEDGLVVARVEKVLSDEPMPAATYYSKEGGKLVFYSIVRNVTVILDLPVYEKRGEVNIVASGVPLRLGSGLLVTTKNYSNMFSIRKILSTGE